MDKLLSVKNLSVSFEGKPVISGISFDLSVGENLAIIGPNGSGKTVLLKSLIGILPYNGEVSWTPHTKIGYVPQKIDADRHLPLTIENLLHAKAGAIGLKKFSVKNSLEEVGLGHSAAKTPIGHLSGGEFQRALIAFALLGNPKVLLFDEPTASIDVSGEELIYELIHELQDKRGISAIVVSHDLSFVYNYATNVLCVNKTGLCFGPPEKTLNAQVLEKVYGPHKYFHHFHHKDQEEHKNA
ncbi:MAG: metal ABC transporter ATP-binding protein [Patescibacteria group bacterium]|nr:metal ABC transporter ATP-binding protein [Patescibacteria group bacterium]MDE2014955.1 metal ABC transporter ATP-binding protein [Patescibacteria group bacterium]MDE2226384.1 metal ABC transporter ATP-binding protein [Patescibacteria group bacterium]